DITARKESEEALVAERRHTEALLQTTMDGIHVFDPAGNLHEWNEAFREHLGYTEEEMGSLSVADWDAQLGREELANALDAIAERPLRFETRHRRRDGSFVDVEISARRIEGEDLLLASSRDITERKRADEVLRASEARYEELATRIPIGVCIFRNNAAGEVAFDYMSDPGARILGVDPASVLADPWQVYGGLAPGELDGLVRLGEERRAANASFHWEGDFLVAGEVRRVRIESEPTPLSDGWTRWHGIIEDVTESRRAEVEIARREADLREAQRIAHVGSWTIDPSTGVATWSDEMHRIFGLAPGSPVPRFADMARFFSPEMLARVNASFETGVATGEPLSAEGDIVRADGTTRHVVVGGEAVRDAAGAVVGLRGTTTDITDLREAQARLEQAQRAETVGRLAAGVAHDFNNQLAAIGGYAEFLASSLPPDDPRRDDVEEIRRAGERAAALTRQLLAFGRRQTLRPVVLDPGEAVAGLAPMLRSLVPAGVELVLPAGPIGAEVRVDRANLEQAIVNLVLNARDAMPAEGTLSITVEAVEVDDDDPRLRSTAVPGPHVRIAVTDTGSGIDPEILPHILEPFFTTKAFGRGSGLGLSSVDGFVAQSGGFIGVESAIGTGSTVSIHLPRAADTSPAALPPAAETAPPPVVGRETILLVDDEPGVLAVTARLLRELGYTVLEASDPAAALAIAESGVAPDLLLTDIVMPGMNGRELAARLTDRHPDLPVLFMSGYDPETVFGDGLLEPGLPLLSKPVDRETLAVRVRELLRVRSRGA
ncbi:MAG: PAS domain S-box protein, partial [Chloroflexota bacterium]